MTFSTAATRRGYVGCYSFDGVVFFGTGFHYNPWAGRGYYGRPNTFGFAAHYNSYQGHWGFGFGLGAAGKADQPGWEPTHGFKDTAEHGSALADIGRPSSAEIQGNGPGRSSITISADVYLRNVYEGRQDLHHDVPGVNKSEPQQPARRNCRRTPRRCRIRRTTSTPIRRGMSIGRRTPAGKFAIKTSGSPARRKHPRRNQPRLTMKAAQEPKAEPTPPRRQAGPGAKG